MFYLFSFTDSQGGTPANTELIVASGETVKQLPADPQKPNYTFAGWWTLLNGGTQFTDSTKVTQDMTVYAKWTGGIQILTVTFNSDGGTPDTSLMTVQTNQALGALPSTPVKTGYTFAGWFTQQDGAGTQITEFTIISQDITVYAYWVTTPVLTVTFNSDGGTPDQATMTVTPGANVGSLPTEPTKTGYAFIGWYTATSGGGIQFTADTAVTQDITVYAYWVSTPLYTISFDTDSDTSEQSPIQVYYGNSIGSNNFPANPTKTHYDFQAWYTETNGGGSQFTASTKVNSDITVYANWSSLSYTVTFDADGGTPATQSIESDTNGYLKSTPDTPSKDNYYFGGWFTEKGGGGTQFSVTSYITQNLTVYAKWALVPTFQVTFYSEGGSFNGTDATTITLTIEEGMNFEQAQDWPAPPTKTGYNFGGWWSLANGGGEQFYETTPVTSNRSVYASWIPVQTLTVTFDPCNGTNPTTVTVSPGGTVASLPTQPSSADGSYFAGWFTEKNGNGNSFDTTTVVTQNITVYAFWTLTPTYQVTFDNQGGDSPEFTYAYTTNGKVSDINFPTDPTRSGYVFQAWYTEPNGGGTQFTTDTEVTHSITVYALWEKATYTVTFIYENNTSQSKIVSGIADGSTVPTSDFPDMTGEFPGYDFGGWYTAPNGPNGQGQEFTSSTPVHETLIVYAYWTPQNYIITFDADGGTPATQTCSADYEQSVSSWPVNPTYANFDFGGWFTQKDGGGTQFTQSTPVTSSYPVYAKWIPHQYIIQFNTQCTAPNPSSITVTASSNLGALLPSQDFPTAPNRSQYFFNNWYTDPSGGTPFTASFQITDANTQVSGSNRILNVYAYWIPQITFTFDLNGVTCTVSTLQNVSFEAGCSFDNSPSETKNGTWPDNPTATGNYRFVEWNTQQGGNGTTITSGTTISNSGSPQTITLYAKWVQTCDVTFNYQDGTTPNYTVTVDINTTIPSNEWPPTPTRSGYTFGGWYTDSLCTTGNEFTQSSTVKTSQPVYAKWTSSTS